MKPTILFADNERGVRRYVQQELTAEGYDVLLTSDGIEVVDVLSQPFVDLVIVDEHMPRCSGVEAARIIKRWDPNLPVILFTADQDYENYRSPLIDRTVIKSEDLGSLKAAVAQLLSSSAGTTHASHATTC